MSHIRLDHLINSAYVNVPNVYTEQLKSIRPELFNTHNHNTYECHSDLQLDSLKYDFSEFDLEGTYAEEALNFLYSHNIPFLLRQQFTDSLYIDYSYLLNPHSESQIVFFDSTQYLVEPIKGRLTELAWIARERTRVALPSAGFINNVMKQQMALFKLTGTIDTLTEFKYESIERKTE